MERLREALTGIAGAAGTAPAGQLPDPNDGGAAGVSRLALATESASPGVQTGGPGVSCATEIHDPGPPRRRRTGSPTIRPSATRSLGAGRSGPRPTKVKHQALEDASSGRAGIRADDGVRAS